MTQEGNYTVNGGVIIRDSVNIQNGTLIMSNSAKGQILMDNGTNIVPTTVEGDIKVIPTIKNVDNDGVIQQKETLKMEINNNVIIDSNIKSVSAGYTGIDIRKTNLKAGKGLRL